MSYSLYLHIPFCEHRCAYCDFDTYAGQQESIPAYVEALRREIQAVGESAPQKIQAHTVFFGGGTPSLLNPSQFESILRTIAARFDLAPDAEISIEANPGTVALDGLRRLRSLGVNRISFGVQSASPEELRQLERQHDYFDVIHAAAWARRAGFENLNLDLIYGLPQQTLERWQATVELILGLRPEHLSLYALTLEHGTPFRRWAARGLMPAPDADLAADMYEWACARLDPAGYEQYEISNWARPGRECRHNLQYWRGLPYLGLGAGAHGYADGLRYSNVLRIKTYIERFSGKQGSEIRNRASAPEARRAAPDPPAANIGFPLSPAAVNHHRQTPQDDMSEFMLTGLRLTREGISPTDFQARFRRDLRDVYGKQIDELIRLDLLELAHPAPSGRGEGGKGQILRLTRRGRLLGNQVFMRFIG